MVTKNQLRIQLFNVLQNEVISEATIATLYQKLSEEELGALVAVFADNLDALYPDMDSQSNKFDNSEWLIDIAKKYCQVLASLKVNFITQGAYIEILDNVLLYLKFRRENSDVGSKDIFDSVHEYVRMLRCKYDISSLSIEAAEHDVLVQIMKTTEPELNTLLMALLCYFSFDNNYIPLVEEFLYQRKKLILSYLKIILINGKKRNFIF